MRAASKKHARLDATGHAFGSQHAIDAQARSGVWRWRYLEVRELHERAKRQTRADPGVIRAYDAHERVLEEALLTHWPVGFWWSELSHPYFVMKERGYEVAIFSPEGGTCQADAMSDPRDPSGYSADDLISLGFIHSAPPTRP